MRDIFKTWKQDVPAGLVVFFSSKFHFVWVLPLHLKQIPFSGLIAGIIGGLVVGIISGSAIGGFWSSCWISNHCGRLHKRIRFLRTFPLCCCDRWCNSNHLRSCESWIFVLLLPKCGSERNACSNRFTNHFQTMAARVRL